MRSSRACGACSTRTPSGSRRWPPRRSWRSRRRTARGSRPRSTGARCARCSRPWALPPLALASALEAVARRLDHSTIYLFIAATTTPIALVLSGTIQVVVLASVWAGAGLGIAFALAWIDAPRCSWRAPTWPSGGAGVVAVPELLHEVGVALFVLFLVGGVPYLDRRDDHAARRPDPWPRTFGFHELFHTLVIAAAIVYFIAMAAWVVPYAAVARLRARRPVRRALRCNARAPVAQWIERCSSGGRSRGFESLPARLGPLPCGSRPSPTRTSRGEPRPLPAAWSSAWPPATRSSTPAT